MPSYPPESPLVRPADRLSSFTTYKLGALSITPFLCGLPCLCSLEGCELSPMPGAVVEWLYEDPTFPRKLLMAGA